MMRLPAIFLVSVLSVAVAAEESNQQEIVFACNYSLTISIGDATHEITHQDRVRNDSAIPFLLQNYKLEMRLSERTGDSVEITLVVSEKSGNTWFPIHASPPSFMAKLGAPTDLAWSDDFVDINLAVMVSRHSR